MAYRALPPGNRGLVSSRGPGVVTAAATVAVSDTERRGPARRARLRQDRLRRKAATAPRPFRIFYEAELGYQQWTTEVRHHLTRVRVVEADGSVRRRTRLAASRDVQTQVARRLVPLVVGLGVLGLVGSSIRADGRPLSLQHVTEAARSFAGVGAEKGATPEALAPVSPHTGPAPAPAPPEAPPGRTVPTQRGALPVGKGMWIWLADQVEGGDPASIVARAKAAGLTHLYVRTASLTQGFYAGPFLDRLLPVAHAAHIRVYAWDFPYLDNVDADVARAVQAITYTTPDGHRVDGYAADVELRSMGVNITPQTGKHFGVALRRAVGPNYPLIACVPRPSPAVTQFPYADLVAAFDAIAPMVYWLGSDPQNHMAGALRDLAAYGKPILPVGQAYDGGDEGGPRGVPSREELIQFMQAGDAGGAAGVSWWSWQHADQEAWDAIKDAAEFRLPVGDPAAYTPGQIMAYQTLLTSLGFQTPIDGKWGEATAAAVRKYQEAALLPTSGLIDKATLTILLTPFAPPVQPQP